MKYLHITKYIYIYIFIHTSIVSHKIHPTRLVSSFWHCSSWWHRSICQRYGSITHFSTCRRTSNISHAGTSAIQHCGILRTQVGSISLSATSSGTRTDSAAAAMTVTFFSSHSQRTLQTSSKSLYYSEQYPNFQWISHPLIGETVHQNLISWWICDIPPKKLL